MPESFMHDGGAKGDALLPAARQASGDQLFLAFESREIENPAFLLFEFFRGDTVDAAEEIQVLGDGEVVVERKLLRHIADLLADFGGAKLAAPPLQAAYFPWRLPADRIAS